jgi:D-alanine transfer protein
VVSRAAALAQALLPAGITTTMLDPDPPEGQGMPPLPVGVLALFLALAIAIAGACAARVAVRSAARRGAHAVAARATPLKAQTVALQRGALERGDLLPLYGSSELYCCGDPYRATQVFATVPSGFDAFAVGGAGVSNLLFMQMFAALGPTLRGRQLVVLNSPPWFTEPPDYRRDAYVSNFSSEIAEAFVFEAPISPGLRAAGARRMLAYPETLQGNLLLRLAVEALAQPSVLHRATYRVLAPLGRLELWIEKSRGAVRTLLFLRHHHAMRAESAPTPHAIDWVALATSATELAVRRNTTNPFGIPDPTYRRIMRRKRRREAFESALAAYRSGATNRDGQLYRVPVEWRAMMAHSEEWTDLRLAAAVLRELGARPFLWTMPLDGFFQNYTPLSTRVRRDYYERWEHVVRPTGFPWLDFRDADEDRYFLTDTGGHLGPRGWTFADYALELYWQGRTAGEIRDAMAALAARVPGPAPQIWTLATREETP